MKHHNQKYFDKLKKICDTYLKDLKKYIKENNLVIYEDENDFLHDSLSDTDISQCGIETVAINLISDPIYVNVYTKDERKFNIERNKLLIDRYKKNIKYLQEQIRSYEDKIKKLSKTEA